MTCAACRISDRCKLCILVNGSTMTLCPPCRRRHDVLIAETAIDGPEDMRNEEAWRDAETLPGGLNIGDPYYHHIDGGTS